MGSVLLLGFLIGLRHAIEADHVAAVAALTNRSKSLAAAARLAAAWGLGHTLMLFAVGAAVIMMDSVMPERIAQYLELAVGIMLCWLGYDVLRRLIRERIHFHQHRHASSPAGAANHFHAHSHKGDTSHQNSAHDHQHGNMRRRAFIIGLVHGMAGSSALILLTLGQFDSWWPAFLYMALFGLGTMLGMALLSVVISLPLQKLANSLTWAHNALNAVTGTATVGLGVWLIYDIGISGGLIDGLISG
ncbi:MAG: urease accessory protein [Rhodospirillaceae bacterium]|jgi:ABC-type nickel/cobalt efflux system permease component RcnA|nr:urease accessory protein [Rhodospirillaceae bacterium]MBT3629179.1 urease accessory protein [Rhodospirillaceae bacterium]MBT5038713.1 urease accessory protein [Rhodospirillaceae bacterium]MBT5675252.1 urease accessory protein [Rhodospirillaceae bacterium]MBT5778061.1 urease accessory protein [Rhodospirillaceae bacterium]